MSNEANFLKFDSTLREDVNVEFKSAKGGVPHSFWPTYSSFANTVGGSVYLGVRETDDGLVPSGLTYDECIKAKSEITTTAANRNKVNVNLLTEESFSILSFGDSYVLRITIPQAGTRNRPVYLDANPIAGTYRRIHDSDLSCSEEEVRSLIRDSSSTSPDAIPLPKYTISDFDPSTMEAYRNEYASSNRSKYLNGYDDERFFRFVGALVEHEGRTVATVAGLLMFSTIEKIQEEFPSYFLDYRGYDGEEIDPLNRWSNRIQSYSLDWSGNVYDFYRMVCPKLLGRLPRPFRTKGIQRIDMSPLEGSVREALCNAFSNYDFNSRIPLAVEATDSYIEIRNPGTMRVPRETALRGGVSDPRNPVIQKMFAMVGVGERAGAGIPLIFEASSHEGMREPSIEESFRPDLTRVRIYLRKRPDAKLAKDDANALRVIGALSEKGPLSGGELSTLLAIPRSTLRRVILALIDEGTVVSLGTGRGTRYALGGDR